MSVLYMGIDAGRTTHILSPDGDEYWVGICGYQTGPPDWATRSSKEQVSHLLVTMERGCTKCAQMTAFQPTGYGGNPR